jgi:RNA-directed DNA polymerase
MRVAALRASERTHDRDSSGHAAHMTERSVDPQGMPPVGAVGRASSQPAGEAGSGVTGGWVSINGGQRRDAESRPSPYRMRSREIMRQLEGVPRDSWRWAWTVADLTDTEPFPPPHARRLARALASAFLTCERWEPQDLTRAGETVLGGRRHWLAPVVSEVLAVYPHPPADSPREFADHLAQSRLFRGVTRSRRSLRRDRVRVWLATPTITVRRPFHTRRIDDIGALAAALGLTIEELDWYADRRNLNRHATDRRLRHYRYLWLNGRLIEAPKQRLLALQRQLLAEVIGPIPTHPAAHGFVPGRSPYTYAAPHVGRPVVIRLDVTSFFASVTAARVYGLLRTAGYPEPVAHGITGLCTTRTPASVLSAAGPGVPDRAYRLSLLRAVHLPQGAPTSPALANLCAFRLDRRLTGLADRFGATFTRYADDLAFSGDLTVRSTSSLIAAVTSIAADEGFRINTGKTRVRGAGDRQHLAGLVVNERLGVPRSVYDALRALLHNAAGTGLDEQNHDGHADFIGHLRGRIAWVGHGHPARAEKLRQLLEAAIAGGVE